MKSPRLLALAVLIALLAGCASPEPTPVDPAKRDAAFKALRDCAQQEVAGMDDGISDASTIAAALATVCSAQYSAVTEVYAAAASPLGAQALRERRAQRARQIETFLPTVLERRAAARPR